MMSSDNAATCSSYSWKIYIEFLDFFFTLDIAVDNWPVFVFVYTRKSGLVKPPALVDV